MQAWDNDHRAKLIDFNTQGSITIDAEAGSVTVGPPDTVTSTLTFDIAWLRPVAHQPEHRQDPLIQGRIRLSRQETA